MLRNIRNIKKNKIQKSKDVPSLAIQKSKKNCTTRRNLHCGSEGVFGFWDIGTIRNLDGGSGGNLWNLGFLGYYFEEVF